MVNEKQTKTKTEKVTVKVSVNKDVKRNRFKRIASQRQGKVIDRIAIFGKIADNPQNYDFVEEDIYSLFTPLEEFLVKTKQRFLDCIDLKEIKDEYKVKL